MAGEIGQILCTRIETTPVLDSLCCFDRRTVVEIVEFSVTISVDDIMMPVVLDIN